MAGPNTRDRDAVAGAMYFIVGRGTEGGPDSYRLSVAGVRDSHWGQISDVAANSGYSIGTIQVDLGQRGTWGVGKTSGPASPGESTYVDALIDESSRYARDHGLAYTQDQDQLRADLLTHGNGLRGRSSLTFIDAATRESINTWASSSEGKQWIHANVDYPQVKNAAESALGIMDAHGASIPDEHRLAAIALLAKTANQFPAQLPRLTAAMDRDGSYESMLEEARGINSEHRVYDGLKAVAVAEQYQAAFGDTERASAIERAQLKVASAGFDPGSQASDHDIATAIGAIGLRSSLVASEHAGILRIGSQGEPVALLQRQLATLDLADRRGHPLAVDGHFGPATRSAVEAFQSGHGLVADGVVGPATRDLLAHEVEIARQANMMSLSDPRHPGIAMYSQALEGVRAIDSQFGRQTDQSSCQLAGALAVGACSAGFTRVDHVVMSDDGSRAYAVQGQLNSPFKQYVDVNVARAVTVPLEQSGAQFLQAAQQRDQQAAVDLQNRTQAQTQEQQAPSHHPVMTR